MTFSFTFFVMTAVPHSTFDVTKDNRGFVYFPKETEDNSISEQPIHSIPEAVSRHKFLEYLKENRRVGVGLVIHLLILLPVVYLVYYIPATPLDENGWLAKYLQNNYFSWSNLVLWMILLASGFSFVSKVTEQRSNMWISRQNDYKEIAKLMVAGPIIFLFGPVFTLAGPTPSHGFTASWTRHEMFGAVNDDSLFSFLYNYFIYTVMYYFGLQWTHFDNHDFLRDMGDKLSVPSRWKTYKKAELIGISLVICCIALPLITFNIGVLIMSGEWLPVLLTYAIPFSIIAVVTYIHRKDWEIHAHHYFWSMWLIPITRFMNPLSALCQAYVTGIFVEGVSRWSMAGLWDRKQ